MEQDIQEVLYSKEYLAGVVQELGRKISEDYKGKNLLMVSVLKGSVVFMADLMRAVTIPCSIDFMSVSSYGSGVKTSRIWISIWKARIFFWSRISLTAV